MRLFQKILGMILLVSLLSACSGSAAGGGQSTPTPVPTPMQAQKPTYVVQRGAVSKVLELRGRVIPLLQQDLFFGADGFVKEVKVRRGDSVQQGDILALLEEPENFAADIATAQLALAQAQNDLEVMKLDAPVKLAEAQLTLVQATDALYKAKIKRDNLDQSRAQDELALKQAQVGLAAAQDAYDSAQREYANYSSVSYDDPNSTAALENLIAARTAYRQALNLVTWLTGHATDRDLALADADLAVAQAKFDRATAEVARLSAEGGTVEMQLAERRILDAQAKLDKAQQAQGKIELRAPFTGQVVSVSIATGDSVTSRKAVVTLVDPSRLEISVIPTAEQAADMGVGQVASVSLTSQPGKDYLAKVRLLPDSNSTSEKRDATARLVLEDASVALTLNEAVVVVIAVETRQDVLWLPPAALRTFQGRDFVLVEENGVQRRVDIRLGLQSDDRIEIASGLEENQVVIGP